MVGNKSHINIVYSTVYTYHRQLWVMLPVISLKRVMCDRYSGFEVTCPDCDLQSALDHAARDK